MNANLRKYGTWTAIYVFGVVMGRMSVQETDKHFPPRYGRIGLPANCSAYVDVTIAAYRAKTYTAEESMAGLERNCSSSGQLWRD